MLVLIWHLAFFSTFYFLLNEWLSSHEFGYGTLVWVYSLYLLWSMRTSYKNFGEQLNILGFAGILVLGFFWLAGSITSIEKVQQLAFIGILFSVVLAMGNWRLLRALFFPLLFMLLSIEMWKVLQIPLRDFSTSVTVKLVQILGIPVLRENYLLSLPGGRFLVEPACSGLSFFMVSLLLALIYSFERKLNALETLVLSTLAVAVAVASNWIRILIIVLVGNSTNMKSILVQEHLIFGWVVYTVAMGLFCAAYYFCFLRRKVSKFHRAENEEDEKNEKNNSTPDSEHNSTFNSTLNLSSNSSSSFLAFGVCAVLLILPSTSQLFLNQLGKNLEPGAVAQRLNSNNKIRKTHGFSKWNPHFINADETHFFYSASTSGNIELYTALYQNQSRGKELINVHNTLYEDKYWRKIDARALSVSVNDQVINGRIEFIQHGLNNPKILFYWFAHADRTSGSASQAKLDHLISVLSGRGSSGSVIALMMPDEGNKTDTYENQLNQALSRILENTQSRN